MGWFNKIVGGIPGASVVLGASVLDLLGAKEQRKAQREMASDQMAFQERMSSTAHQRQVADLRSAGLNPILSAGGGASAPAGAGYTPESLLDGMVERGATTAMAMKRLAAEIRQIDQMTATARQQERNLVTDNAIANNDLVIKSAERFAAENRMLHEMKAPEFFGAVDAWARRMGLIGSSARDFGGLLRRGKTEINHNYRYIP